MRAEEKQRLDISDAFGFLAGIEDESVDLIVTDPPYWTLDKWRNFCDHETLRYVLSYADDMDWRKVKPLVWDKVLQGMGYTYRCRHEFIVFLEKGKRRLNNLSIPDILRVKKVVKGYPTEKPVELMKVLVSQSSSEDELVCDPFFGSGSVAVAAKELHRRFTGSDINPGALSYFEARAENKQAGLFG